MISFDNVCAKELKEKGSTLWGLFNAVTHYTNHVQVANSKTDRLSNVMQGAGERLNRQTYAILDKYMTDEFLDDVDIFGNDPDAINGAFSLYRNIEKVNKLFYRVPFWNKILEEPRLLAFDEIHITNLLRTTDDIRFKSGYLQENDKQPDHIPVTQVKLLDNGKLINTKTGNEMMMFHFNRTRKWTY